MTHALWVAQALLALLFLFAGVMKLVLPLDQMAGPVELPGLFLRFIGVAETLGALGLILPGLLGIRPGLTPLAAAGLVVVMIGATAVTQLSGLDGARVIGDLPSGLPAPSLAFLDVHALGSLLPSAVAVMALAALESLLSASVADGMTVGQRHDPDRELFGQGLANIAAPLFGGVPATGAIALVRCVVIGWSRLPLPAARITPCMVAPFYGSIRRNSFVDHSIICAALAGWQSSEFYGNDAFRLQASPLRFATLVLWLVAAAVCIGLLVDALRGRIQAASSSH